MPDEYQIVFNSQGRNVINSDNICEIVYNVNWTAFLDMKYKKFKCSFSFTSDNGGNQLIHNGTVSINFGRTNIYDGLQMSHNLGIIYPQYLTGGDNYLAYHTARTSDNNGFIMDFPTNSVVTVTLKTFTGGNLANMTDYVLMLSLIGIEE